MGDVAVERGTIPLPKTVRGLMESPLGSSILTRLAVADVSVLITDSVRVASWSKAVVINGHGFELQMRPYEADGSLHEKLFRTPLSIEDALAYIRQLNGAEVVEEDLVRAIVHRVPDYL